MSEHEGYFLGAYAVNAIDYERARVEWIIVHESIDGKWCDNDGNEVLVFFTEPITIPSPTIPEGWIEHVHEEAQRIERDRRDNMRPSGLAALIAAKPKPEPIPTLTRRGF